MSKDVIIDEKDSKEKEVKKVSKTKNIVEEKEESKSKKKIRIIITIIALILVFGGLFYLIYNASHDDKVKKEVKVLDTLDKYGYSLSDNDSELYKSEFKILKDILDEKEIDNKKYSEQIAKLFVIDLYTLDTKVNIYDVGGIEFYYTDKKDMFEKKVINEFYNTLEDNTYGDREQDLPIVKSIEIVSITDTERTINDKNVSGYKVEVKWTYEKDMGYDDEGTIIIMPDGDYKYSVADFEPKIEESKKDLNDDVTHLVDTY